MQHDFYRVLRALDGEKQADVLLGLLAGLLRVDLDDLSLVFPVHEVVAVNQGADLLCVVRVFAGYKYDRFHIVKVVVGAVFPQDGLAVLVQGQPVTDLHLLDVVLAVACDVGAAHDDRNLEVSFGGAACHVVGVDDVRRGLRRGREFQSENRLQIVDGLHGRRCIVVVCLVHADHKVVELRKNVSEGCAERLLELVEVELRVRLAVEYLPDVEDEELNLRRMVDEQGALLVLHRILVVVLAVPDPRPAHLGLESLEDVLRVRGV